MMGSNFRTVLISKEQVANLFRHMSVAVFLVEEAFRTFSKGNVMLPDKISQIFNQETQDRINCMPATLIDEKVCGVKWVSVFPNNPKVGINNVSGVVILSEIEHGLPIAVMDGTVLTSIRTAAVGACAVKYLSNKKSDTIGFIGAGREARTHLDMILSIKPGLKRCYVSSRSESTVSSFINEEKMKHPDLEIVGCGNNFERAVVNADIIVTATSSQADLLKAKWIKEGATYIHVGGWEDEYDVPRIADKIICDRWECVKHRGQTICRMFKEGLLQDSDIYSDLVDIITGDKPGRENEKEFIYFNSVGLAFIDVYFANWIYEQLKDTAESFCF